MITRLAELVAYRELLRNLVARDLKVRYKNSVLGILWSLLNPLLMMTVLTIVYTAMIPSDISDFPVFVLLICQMMRATLSPGVRSRCTLTERSYPPVSLSCDALILPLTRMFTRARLLLLIETALPVAR